MPTPMQTVNMSQVPLTELAKAALNIFSKVSITADESSLIVAIQLRSLLQGLADGSLVVGRPVAEKEPEAALANE